MNKQHIIKRIEENKQKIKNCGVKKIELFGSYASDKEHLGSDIDFLVEFKSGRGLIDDHINLLHLLRSLFDRNIDLIKKELIKKELKKSILQGERIAAKL